jgi:hypothetical protein
MKIFLMSAFALAIALSSCDKPESARIQTKEEILADGEWVLQSLQEKTGSGSWVTQTQPTCDNDNRYIFKGQGTFLFNDGAVKCDPSEPDVKGAGTWKLLDSGAKLSLQFTGEPDPVIADIIEIDADHFVTVSTDGAIQSKETFVHP